MLSKGYTQNSIYVVRKRRSTQHMMSNSEWLCNWRSVSRSVLTLSPSGTHDQVLVVVKTVAFFLVVERCPCREDKSVV